MPNFNLWFRKDNTGKGGYQKNGDDHSGNESTIATPKHIRAERDPARRELLCLLTWGTRTCPDNGELADDAENIIGGMRSTTNEAVLRAISRVLNHVEVDSKDINLLQTLFTLTPTDIEVLKNLQ